MDKKYEQAFRKYEDVDIDSRGAPILTSGLKSAPPRTPPRQADMMRGKKYEQAGRNVPTLTSGMKRAPPKKPTGGPEKRAVPKKTPPRHVEMEDLPGQEGKPRPDQPDKQEDTDRDGQREETSFCYKARGRVKEMWSTAISGTACWLTPGRVLLVGAAVCIAVGLSLHLSFKATGSPNEDVVATTEKNNNLSALGSSTFCEEKILFVFASTSTPLRIPKRLGITLSTAFYRENISAIINSTYKALSTQLRRVKSTTTVTAGIVPRNVAPLPETAPQCQLSWNEDNNYCYKLIRDPVSWSEADRGCRRLDAHLASVLDYQESRFITRLISDVDNRLVWLGLRREAPSSPDGRWMWMWTDGSRCSYTNWVPGEPNNDPMAEGPKGEHCAGARPRVSGFQSRSLLAGSSLRIT
ncbi:hypothetical protein Bbelb_415090 [Branchiostoma belcheri]|nr:hypothetical protein Bbelb_415090 [Branchiostoma belcheri]